jgi:hypothetical protein
MKKETNSNSNDSMPLNIATCTTPLAASLKGLTFELSPGPYIRALPFSILFLSCQAS